MIIETPFIKKREKSWKYNFPFHKIRNPSASRQEADFISKSIYTLKLYSCIEFALRLHLAAQYRNFAGYPAGEASDLGSPLSRILGSNVFPTIFLLRNAHLCPLTYGTIVAGRREKLIAFIVYGTREGLTSSFVSRVDMNYSLDENYILRDGVSPREHS